MPRTPYVPKRPALDPCPVEEVIGMIGGKWKSRLLLLLSAGPHRLSELRRALGVDVSNEVLITQLQGLAADGLVEITVEANGATSHRRYGLTPLGESLLSALDTVAAWGAERIRERGHERRRPDRTPSPAATHSGGQGDPGGPDAVADGEPIRTTGD
jgi:DNA-binding HxlR family transcriptional regulator